MIILLNKNIELIFANNNAHSKISKLLYNLQILDFEIFK